MATVPTYVIITPARNEIQFLELTLKSVLSQTILPLRWVVVSDGSTDGTDELVQKYAADHPWIELVRMPERKNRHFAGKVHAFNAGYSRVQGLDFQVLASLDADVSFDENYFSFLLQKLAADAGLGLIGTPFKETSNQVYDYRFVNIEHVSGACQVFRRECFEQIGGYQPIEGGGIDYVAVLTARMKGWKTRTFTETICLHHREMGTAQQHLLSARFKYGVKDYNFGNHPAWEFFRIVYQMTKPPLAIGGIALAAGYTWASMIRRARPVSKELVAFSRREQMQRLRNFFGKRFSPKSTWARTN